MGVISYLDRFLEPMTVAFTPELARVLADLRADDEVCAELDELRQKASRGTLSPDEDASYRELVEAIDVVSIIQSKARRYLASHPAENGRDDS